MSKQRRMLIVLFCFSLLVLSTLACNNGGGGGNPVPTVVKGVQSALDAAENVTGAGNALAEGLAVPTAEATDDECVPVAHKIQKRETLYLISRKYGVGVSEIVKANSIVLPEGKETVLEVGWMLNIPCP